MPKRIEIPYFGQDRSRPVPTRKLHYLNFFTAKGIQRAAFNDSQFVLQQKTSAVQAEVFKIILVGLLVFPGIKGCGFLQPVFSLGFNFFYRYQIQKKQKLTDIGFIGFSRIKGNGFFSMDIWIRLMFMEHQPTSDTKI